MYTGKKLLKMKRLEEKKMVIYAVCDMYMKCRHKEGRWLKIETFLNHSQSILQKHIMLQIV